MSRGFLEGFLVKDHVCTPRKLLQVSVWPCKNTGEGRGW